MTIISYAQNLEDIILWRALKHIKDGFYIDVGANDPAEDSVTKLFYDKGWHGINIEPIPRHHKSLEKDRERDLNLRIAAGSTEGEIELWDCEVRGWSTANQSVIEQHIISGTKGNFLTIPVDTLKNICRKNAPSEIHFLKIDVEGFEKEVIKGNDWSSFRPWVVVVESTKPNTMIDNYSEWEDFLLNADYSFAYTDGINRFYLSNEHTDLSPHFSYPPNVFDDYKTAAQYQVEIRAAQAKKAEELARKSEEQAMQELEITRLALQNTLDSYSWRITTPLRWVKHQTNLLQQQGFYARAKALVKKTTNPFIGAGITFINSHPKLRYQLVTLSKKTRTYYPLKSVYLRLSGNTDMLSLPSGHMAVTQQPGNMKNLTPHASAIYANLKHSIKKHQENND